MARALDRRHAPPTARARVPARMGRRFTAPKNPAPRCASHRAAGAVPLRRLCEDPAGCNRTPSFAPSRGAPLPARPPARPCEPLGARRSAHGRRGCSGAGARRAAMAAPGTRGPNTSRPEHACFRVAARTRAFSRHLLGWGTPPTASGALTVGARRGAQGRARGSARCTSPRRGWTPGTPSARTRAASASRRLPRREAGGAARGVSAARCTGAWATGTSCIVRAPPAAAAPGHGARGARRHRAQAPVPCRGRPGRDGSRRRGLSDAS